MIRIRAGFTLIELMIAIAIISIVTAVAIPAYRDFTIRGRISEAILATSQCRTAIAGIYESSPRGSLFGTDKWGCGERMTTTQYVASISTDPDGIITVTMSANASLGAAASTTMTLTPIKDDGTPLAIRDVPKKVFAFKCGPGGVAPIAAKYLPGSCRGEP